MLAPIATFLADPEVSEILINRPQEVWVEKQGCLNRHVIEAFHELHLNRLFQLIANENHQRLSKETPLLSGSLTDGSRVQLCLPPTARYHTLSIRRKVRRQMKLDDYPQEFYTQARATGLKKSCSPQDKHLLELYQKQAWGCFIRAAVLNRKNILISGGTSSGKTTFLNACLQEIDIHDRLLILEDTREVETTHPNQVQLVASKGEQGEAKITMQDLVQCCLRLRPDRIIMGEIRGKEILDFISACSTGHEGSISTIHANSPKIALMRMTQLYKLNNVPSMTEADIMRELMQVIDVIIQVNKTIS